MNRTRTDRHKLRFRLSALARQHEWDIWITPSAKDPGFYEVHRRHGSILSPFDLQGAIQVARRIDPE